MLKSFGIQNFRCFKEIKLDTLTRFNLILGQNNVGKTNLLESLFILSGATNPHTSIDLNKLREGLPIPSDPLELWQPLFYQFDINQPIILTGSTDNDSNQEINHELSIELINQTNNISQDSSQNISEEVIFEATAISTTIQSYQLSYRYKNSLNPEKIITTGASVTQQLNGKTEIKGDIKLPVLREARLLPFRRPIRLPVLAQQFSLLQKEGLETELIDALKTIEPRLKSLLIDVTQPQKNKLLADLGEKRRVPIGYLGDGFNLFLEILLHLYVMRNKNGLLLIDEIENGLHYSVLESFWAIIIKFSIEWDVQIIATTHSLECVKAAYFSLQSLDKNTQYKKDKLSNLSVYRLERLQENIIPIFYDPPTLKMALDEFAWEVR